MSASKIPKENLFFKLSLEEIMKFRVPDMSVLICCIVKLLT